jgi:DNA-binding MarR family transcriptional regulator
MQRPARTPAGDAATEVVLANFRTNGLLLAAGDVLAADEGLTSARWQVLGAIALAGTPLTVPQVARRMGLTRQSVQVSVNRLIGDELVRIEDNPDHRRSPLIRLTQRGVGAYEALARRQARWIDALAAGLPVEDLATTARVLTELGTRLTNDAQPGEKER